MDAEGRRELFESLVQNEAAGLYRLAYRLCGDRDGAEDLVQESYVEAWRSIETLRDARAARAWLSRILRHRFAHSLRRRARRPMWSTLEREDEIQQQLNRLPADERELLLLVYLSGMSCREAADELGLPLGTVLSKLHRARAKIRNATPYDEQAR